MSKESVKTTACVALGSAALLVMAGMWVNSAATASGQPSSPIVAGGFQQLDPAAGSAPYRTLILVNDSSRLQDYQLANISQALTGRRHVWLATRYAGMCGKGEWCLSVTDATLGRAGTPEAMGAAVADAVVEEIGK